MDQDRHRYSKNEQNDQSSHPLSASSMDSGDTGASLPPPPFQLQSHSHGQAPIQRKIEGYKGKTLRKDAKVLQGLNPSQIEEMQRIHREEADISQDDARIAVGALPLPKGSESGNAPFPWRWDQSQGGKGHLGTPMNSSGGFVQNSASFDSPSPFGGFSSYNFGVRYEGPESGDFFPVQEDENSQMTDIDDTDMDITPLPYDGPMPQISAVLGSSYGDLSSTSKRAVTQSSVMDNVSPNKAANALGFPNQGGRGWEWLHLVAFSIQQTHVGAISQTSLALMDHTRQPQQIRENLVLGSAESNTAMLAFESHIKQLMAKDRSLQLNLFVAADKADRQVVIEGRQKVVPVATRIRYHFNFTKAPNLVSAPVLVDFDPQNRAKPCTHEYAATLENLRNVIQGMAPHSVNGIDSSQLTSVN